MEKTQMKKFVDGKVLLQWFYFGFQEVYQNKKYLNAINVFPVADGDTGTNLSITLKAMVEKPIKVNTFSGMLQAISEAGLANARGNSGILFASYVNGIASEGSSYKEVTLEQFSSIAYKAVSYLYQAVEKPIEGTMISVIKDWANYLYQNFQNYDNFKDLFANAYLTAQNSLKMTTSQLEVLKKNKVVDSGADGFVRFLNGINYYYLAKKEVKSDNEVQDSFNLSNHEQSNYLYCTEFFMDISEKDIVPIRKDLKKIIRDKINQLGDSLIITSFQDKVKIHIHTDVPEIVAQSLRPFGTFIEHKVDNMHLQNSIKTRQLSRIGIVTDSIADIPEDYKLKHQIHTLPLGLLIDDSVYLDKSTIKLEQLFHLMKDAESYPTSSQPEPGRVSIFLDNLLETYDYLIFITVSSELSGTYQTIQQEIKKIKDAEKKITLIDSKTNSGAEGLLVKYASNLLNNGLSYEEIAKKVKEQIPKTYIYVCLNTLEYAVRSGRVPNTVGKVGMKLGLRPIMTIDRNGKGAAFGVGFSQKGMTKKIFNLIKSTIARKGIQSYCIVHADNLELAMEYKSELTKMIGKEPEFITEISSVVAIHSGLGCVAVCFTEN
ncbi:DegV family EDD domain-containing protein [Mobilitalea sibirica]|uniref:DegV family EDD domain-containing protein n=1 Tax=Mobilitalea sibirica TaxID=1462919 RepID=A0A8J7HBT2_9FIRM|nr:DegV family protein [Mobilitalea sibirica]MBH1939589.1 DegV family EDD domain-containing protein [Mobilitalea sibirica]